MPKPYSMDLRKRVVAACDAGESPEVVGPHFSVAVRTVYYWLDLRRETGGVAPRPSEPGPKPILAAHADRLRELVALKPDATLHELRADLPVNVVITTVSNMLQRMGLTRKKEGHPRRRAVAA